ncbi:MULTISPECIES: hypothetical protein [unclassified Streptomyces]|uniref:hypothetical protein n=1 Tax=unclassified Streptomyces TaxID=2593676 RepID=UPI00380FB5F9
MPDSIPPVYETYLPRTPIQLMGGVGWKRLVAFRIDERGVTLGGAPLRYKAHTVFVPWADITALALWQLHSAGTTLDHVGVQRRAGASPLPGPNDGRLTPERAAKLAPHVDYEVMMASRAITFWKLDPARLQAAVDAFAPNVPVVVYQAD